MKLRYLVYKAYHYWNLGEPLPVDVYGELLRNNIEPELLLDAFELGYDARDLRVVDESEFEEQLEEVLSDLEERLRRGNF